MISVPVDLGDRSYDVLVGAGARHRLCEVIPPGATRAAIVVQPATDFPVDAGIEQRTFLLDEGEEAKCMESVEELCRAFSRWGLTRGDVVVAVGGGVVTDTAGFAAAVYHRGVAVVHVSTTLLGMVDAAIGGKTGVNLPEGKNLVGAFWQPSAVLCDIELLSSLPPREYRSGLGEMAKYAFLGVDDLPDLPLDEAVAACVRCKAAHVGPDERDTTGRRALLNYGHTLAHALETTGHYDLRHGEAVAVGLVFAARLAHRLGRVDDERVKEHEAVVGGYDLPQTLPEGADVAELVKVMGRDKKAVAKRAGAQEGAARKGAARKGAARKGAAGSDGCLTFVLDGRRGLEVVDSIDADVVADVLDEEMRP